MPTTPRFSFAYKGAACLALVACADLLFWNQEVGWTGGGFALAWTALAALVPGRLARRPVRLALLAAAGFGIVLVDDPGPLALLLMAASLASAALLARADFDDAFRWALRLAAHGVATPFRPLRDLLRLGGRRSGGRIRAAAGLLALPLIGGLAFALLFAAANPVIGAAFARLELPSFGRALFWLGFVLLLWSSFRPFVLRLPAHPAGEERWLPDLPLATLALSLVVFNAVFAVENLLDLVFLWSGAALPDGVSLADYAHRGAYLLIVTALLAGGFVLLAFRPGSAAARSPLVRWLVVGFVAQNLLLVASSARRTLDYVAAYQMTELRLAALAWMALVACGLVLVCWRLLAGRSARWLLNANAAAALLVLAGGSAVDLGATAAAWNVGRARNGNRIDLCYLHRLGPSALLPVIALERRAGGPRLADRAAWLRAEALGDLRAAQADWHRWTWRGARRLARAEALLGPAPAAPLPAPHGRDCDGARRLPPPPLAPAPTPPRPATPLTNGSER